MALSPGRPADAIVVAAGASTRMAGTDKLLAPIGDRPLLAHAVLALTASPAIDSIVVVTTDERRDALLGGRPRTPAPALRRRTRPMWVRLSC